MSEEQRDLSTRDLAEAGRQPDHDPDAGHDPAIQQARPESRMATAERESMANADREHPTSSQAAAEMATAERRPEPAAGGTAGSVALLDEQKRGGFSQRWDGIQTGFVDEPRRAVEEADRLVADVIQELAATFAREREQLEERWSRQDEVSTEDLRVSLQRYREFFRVLARF